MITPGLVSVTFRSLDPREIIGLCVRAGLRAIEWGGDVHCPVGDLARAAEVASRSRDAGIAVACYGSYHRCLPGQDFAPVLDTALALGAPVIRVWAGNAGSAVADDAQRESVQRNARAAVALASGAGVRVAFEWHDNTLSDTLGAGLALLEAVPGARALWQPPHALSEPERLAQLPQLGPWLEHVHVFHWVRGENGVHDRRPLRDGAQVWPRRLSILRAVRPDAHALLEFVRDERPEQLLEDAATLREWLTDQH